MVKNKLARLNPQQAYQMGRAEGEKISKAMDIRVGVKLALAHLLISMAYVNEKDDGTTYLTKPKFKEFYEQVEKTIDKFIEDSIDGEEGIDIADIADLYVEHDSFTRKKYGLPERNYNEIIKTEEAV